MPSRIYYIGEKTIAYLYSYFSISILLKTLFDYWKKDDIDTTNMALDDKIRVLMMNLVSRFVGFTVRSITILVGLVIILLTVVLVMVSLVGFILLPLLCVALVIYSIAGL